MYSVSVRERRLVLLEYRETERDLRASSTPPTCAPISNV
jgi:hypothetical protein